MRGGPTAPGLIDRLRRDYATLRVSVGGQGHLPVSSIADAASELEVIDAARPPCPTCDGTTTIGPPADGRPSSGPCPDCVDGKVSIEQLAATWRRVWLIPVKDRHHDGGEYGEGWQACIDHLRAVRP